MNNSFTYLTNLVNYVIISTRQKELDANTVKYIAPPIDIEKREAKIVGFS